MKQWELRGVTIPRARGQRVVDVSIPEESDAKDHSALRVVVEQFPALIWTTDRDLRFTSSIGAGLASIGLGPNQVVGTRLGEFFEADGPGFAAIDAHVRALAGESVAFELKWAGRRFACRVAPLLDGQGIYVGTVAVAVDLNGVHGARHEDPSRRLAAVG